MRTPLTQSSPLRGEGKRRAGPLEHLSIVVVGHVDHGKSTLLGRLYADTDSLPDGKLEKVQAICRQQGKEFEYAFLFDTFLEEQEQGVTIDTARTFFTWGDRQYILIDAPGHKEFLKNMVSGAARAEAALLVIDAHEGVQDQSRKHGYLLSLLGVRQVAVVVNKMDLAGYRRDVFEDIQADFNSFLAQLRVIPERFIPVSARQGDNVASPSANMPWYSGPTVLDTLGLFRKEAARDQQPLRFPVQDVYKFDDRRIIAGRVAAGRLHVGDRLVFSPSNKTAQVRTIEAFNVDPPPTEASAGDSIGITLDEHLFVERGEVASHEDTSPAESTTFRSNLFWMGSRPLDLGRKYLLRLATREVECEAIAIHGIVNAEDLDARNAQGSVGRNEVAEITLRTRSPIAFDLYGDLEVTGRFVLVDGYDVSGGGILTEALPDEQTGLREEARRRDLSWIRGDVGAEDRAIYYGHRASLVLVTGGGPEIKSELARLVERRLVADSRHAYLLEAENLRRGLDADIAIADQDEIVRRFGEVARLLIDTGLIVVSTNNALGPGAEDAVRALVNPAPVLVVQLGQGPASDAEPDLALEGGEDPGVAADVVIETLRQRDILASAVGGSQRYEYGRYSI